MKHTFKLSEIPKATFQIESSIWTGKSTLSMDGTVLDQSNEKGKPFLIPAPENKVLKAFPKSAFPDSVPLLEINGKKHRILKKLKWFQYLLAGLPILLLLVGGALGGALGGAATVVNLSIFRQQGTETSRYLKVLGVVLVSFLLYALFAAIIFGTIF